MAENLNKPGVYRGQAKLATQQDLALLRQEIRQLIAGPISEISENGYIPWKYNNDGSLDIEYLFPEMVQSFQENTGLKITKNGISVANNIKSLNFAGNYVFLDTDENGGLIVDIRPPKQEVSRFNDVDGVTDSILRIRREILSGAIIPDDSAYNEHSSYGDWQPGSIHEYINWNGSKSSDILILSTNESIYASDTNSWFIVNVFDGFGTLIATFTSKSISGNKDPLGASSSGQSPFVNIAISETKNENGGGISFKPEFKFNLIGIFGQVNDEPSGGRFHIEITHSDGVFQNQFISKDYLYNVGKVPVIGMADVDIIDDPSLSGKSKFSYCSGIKYISNNGKVILRVQNIQNLNNMAAIADKVEYKFDVADEKVLKEYETFEKNNNDLENICNWSTTLFLNKDTFNNSESSGYIIFKNAFGESQKEIINVPVLLNSKEIPTESNVSNLLNEYFYDETFRRKHTFEYQSSTSNEWVNLIEWDSKQDLNNYDEGLGLMVIPGVGLTYPSGDWRAFKPTGPDYSNPAFLCNEKYYCRVFKGSNNAKLGGKFILKGITKDFVLKDGRFSCFISNNNGSTWYSLTMVRGTQKTINIDSDTSYIVQGVLTDIQDIEDGVEISWAYPPHVSPSNKELYFKLGLKQTSTVIIKSISLINLNDDKEW